MPLPLIDLLLFNVVAPSLRLFFLIPWRLRRIREHPLSPRRDNRNYARQQSARNMNQAFWVKKFRQIEARKNWSIEIHFNNELIKVLCFSAIVNNTFSKIQSFDVRLYILITISCNIHSTVKLLILSNYWRYFNLINSLLPKPSIGLLLFYCLLLLDIFSNNFSFNLAN